MREKNIDCYSYLVAGKYGWFNAVVDGIGNEIEGHGFGFVRTIVGVVSMLVGMKLALDTTAAWLTFGTVLTESSTYFET